MNIFSFFTKLIDWIVKTIKNSKYLYDWLKKLKNLWNIYVVFSLLFLTFCCLISFGSIYNWCINETPASIHGIVSFIHDHRMLIVIIIFFTYSVGSLYKVRSYSRMKEVESNRISEAFSALHKGFVHELRNDVFEFEKRTRECKKAKSNAELFDHYKKTVRQELITNSKDVVNFVSEYLSRYYGETITVTIKTLDHEHINVKTLVRSTNTIRTRNKDDDTIKLKDIPIFDDIVNKGKHFSACGNLSAAAEKGLYPLSSNLSIWKGKYESTLVTPIRYYSGYSKHNNRDLELETLGFLCIDSQNAHLEWERDDTLELHLLGIVSDGLFIYFWYYHQFFSALL